MKIRDYNISEQDNLDTVSEDVIPVIKVDFGWFKGLFWDYYYFLDLTENNINKVLDEYNVPVKFLPQAFGEKTGNFVFAGLKTRKKHRKMMLESVFPALHKTNILLGGRGYLEEFRHVVEQAGSYMTIKNT